MNVGDRVKFTNHDFDWCGEEFTVTYVGESIARVMTDSGISQTFGKCNLEVVEQEPTDDFQRAWESVWDTICNHAPENLTDQDGSGVEIAVELIKTLSKHYEETTVKPIEERHSVEFEEFKEFSKSNHDLDISFINGSVIVTQWPSDDVIEYSVENEEELHEVVKAFEVLDKYRKG